MTVITFFIYIHFEDYLVIILRVHTCTVVQVNNTYFVASFFSHSSWRMKVQYCYHFYHHCLVEIRSWKNNALDIHTTRIVLRGERERDADIQREWKGGCEREREKERETERERESEWERLVRLDVRIQNASISYFAFTSLRYFNLMDVWFKTRKCCKDHRSHIKYFLWWHFFSFVCCKQHMEWKNYKLIPLLCTKDRQIVLTLFCVINKNSVEKV